LCATFDAAIGPVIFFLDIIKLSATNAKSIHNALLPCLTSHGFSEEFLTEYWMGFGADGASVVFGSKSGVAAQLKAKFPLIISWHCFNHW